MPTRTKRRGLVIEVAAPILLLLGWGAATHSGESFYFPPLVDILSTFGETWLSDRVGDDAVPSITRMLAGYVIAVALGVAAGFAIGLSRIFRELTEPVVEFMRALPAPVLIPVGIIVLGVGDSMKIGVIVLGSLFPVLLNTIEGVRGVDRTLLDTARTFGIPRAALLWRVVAPGASPQIMAGARTSLSVAIIMMVSSELVASDNGIGYAVLQAQRSFAMPQMWAGILLLGILGFLFNAAFALVERRVLRWHRGVRAVGDAS
jgi:ABC-type nitrate/sulfonate/bicarbonate transport system permease component